MPYLERFPCFRTLAMTVAVLLILVTAAWSQVIGSVPQNFKLDGLIGEWDKDASSFSRDKTNGRNPAWIARSSGGLIFAGSSRFPFLGPARDAEELSTKGRLEIWLSLSDEIEMPPIGWYGDEPQTEEACVSGSGGAEPVKQACLEWLRHQSEYREKLRGLFTRMWRIAPNITEEAHANLIYASLTDAQRKELAQLKPNGQPLAKFSLDQFGHEFTFEVLVPWEAFPPGDRLHLERIKLALNIIEGDEILVTTHPASADVSRPGLRSFALVPPVVTQFTPCDYPLTGRSGEPVFCFLGPLLTVRGAFTLANELPCCGAISMPPSDALSPRIVPVEYFVQTLAPGEFLCGSPLVYRNGSAVKRFPFEIGPGAGFSALGPAPRTLPVFRLPNGTRLIKDGPSWSLRQQSYTMCAACPWAKLAIFALKPSGEIKKALTLGGRVGDIGLEEYDIEMSADWRTVTEFRNNSEKWTSRRFCLNGDTYQSCGQDSNSPPPKHGLLPPVP
jgi:hypothetical protein